jgi:O-antigen/teichoic acid export membrane protein
MNVALLFALNIVLIPHFGVMGAVVAASVSSVATAAAFTYDATVWLRVGSFVPLGSLARTLLASILMSVGVLSFGYLVPISSGATLGAAILAGILVYLFGLRIARVFTETDRRLVESSSIPLKRIIIRLFWGRVQE